VVSGNVGTEWGRGDGLTVSGEGEVKVKVQQTPLHAGTGPECYRRLRLPDFKITSLELSKDFSTTQLPNYFHIKVIPLSVLCTSRVNPHIKS
jgi:hypothetical protein